MCYALICHDREYTCFPVFAEHLYHIHDENTFKYSHYKNTFDQPGYVAIKYGKQYSAEYQKQICDIGNTIDKQVIPQGIFQKGQDAYGYFSPDVFFGIYTIYFR